MTASRAMPGHGDVGRVSGGAPVTATAWGTITSTFAQPTLTGSGSNCRRPWLTCGQHVAGEQVALGGVRVAGQDERLDAGVGELVDLRQHLVGIADDRRTGARAGPADAGPQVTLDVPLVVGLVAERRLAGHAGRRRVERPLTDRRAGVVVELREQPARRGAGLVLGLAHDHVGAPAVAQLPALGVRPGVHVGLHVEHLGRRVRPHEEHVRTARRALPGRRATDRRSRTAGWRRTRCAPAAGRPRDRRSHRGTSRRGRRAARAGRTSPRSSGDSGARWRASRRAGRWR